MTLLGAVGFEGWGGYPAQYGGSGAVGFPQQATVGLARTGAQYWNDGGLGQGFGFAVADADQSATLIAGVAFVDGGSHEIMSFWGDRNNAHGQTAQAAGTQHVTISTTGTDLNVYRGTSAGTLLASLPAGTLASGAYLYLEAKVTLSDTVGAVEVRLDGTTIISISGVDTKNGGTETTLDGVSCVGGTSGSGTRFDDFYVCNDAGSANNDFLTITLESVHVERLFPNGNGNSSQWTNDAGNSTNNYTHVDDGVTQNTADYVETDVTNNKDTYATGDSVFPTGDSVAGVVIHALAEKTDAGARELTFVARLSATETTVAANKALFNGTYQDVWGVMETKPGGGAWTVADANGAEFGIKATT